MEQRWLARPATIRKLWAIFVAILVASVAAELFVRHEAQFGIDGAFAFHAWFGFLACAALVLIAKLLGVVLKRSDTYYEKRHG